MSCTCLKLKEHLGEGVKIIHTETCQYDKNKDKTNERECSVVRKEIQNAKVQGIRRGSFVDVTETQDTKFWQE